MRSISALEGVKITPAQPQDAPGIAEVRRQIWLDEYPSFAYGIYHEELAAKDFTGPAQIAQIQGQINHPQGRWWVVKAGNEVVGCAFGFKGQQSNEARSLYLLPSYRGKGIGRQLVESVEGWLGATKDVMICVVAYNQKAISYWLDRGFTLVGDIVHDDGLLPCGKMVPAVRMTKYAA